MSPYEFNPDNIPSVMRDRAVWVNWTMVDGKKIPRRPDNPTKNASVAAPKTWASFSQAAANANGQRGVGYVITRNDPIAFVDLDWHSGEQTDLQSRIIDRLATYTEISPSGRGAHCFVKADKAVLDHAVKVDSLGVEIYFAGRYSTITGLPGPFGLRPIAERTGELLDVLSWVTVQKGQRNNTLIRQGGRLRHQGMGRAELAQVLPELNGQLCDPPLPDNEVAGMVDRLAAYDLSGFTSVPRSVQGSDAYMRLSPTQKACLWELAFRATGRATFTAPFVFFSERGWNSPKTVSRALRGLEAAGFVHVVRKGRSHVPTVFALSWLFPRTTTPLNTTIYKDYPFDPEK